MAGNPNLAYYPQRADVLPDGTDPATQAELDAGLATKVPAFVATAIKTANYTAASSDYALIDATAASRTVMLPTAPADQTRIGVKMVATSGTNSTAVVCGGPDHFNLSTGATTLTLSKLNQAVMLQYVASTATWLVQADDLPLGAVLGLPLALTGATAATRFAGATASAAPTSGTFALGDFVIDQTGKIWVCTTAGTPGTWTQAGSSLTGTTGASNTALGTGAGTGSGTQNVSVGVNALTSITSGVSNTALGFQAGYFDSTGNLNAYVGQSAGQNITTGSGNTAVGAGALTSVFPSTASNITAIGRSALTGNTSGASLVAVGFEALKANTTGSFNVAVGPTALWSCTTGASNVAIGASALETLTTATGNTAIGVSMHDNTTGDFNTAIGYHSLFKNTTGTLNAALGTNSMFNNTTGSRNTAAGSGGLQGLTAGADDNVGIGYHAHYGPGNDVIANTLTTGLRNTALGTQTGLGSATQRNDTIAIGYRALVDGDYAIAIGSGASAGAAGAVAIGKDSAGTAASTATADEIKMGTALHTVTLLGFLKWGAAGNEQTTVGAAGGASALPATPTKYLKIKDSAGTTLVIPAYAAA